MNYFLGLDVGGTEVKCAILDENGTQKNEQLIHFSANSNDTKEVILDNFYNIIIKLVNEIKDESFSIFCIGLTFPDPFDYENGVCLIPKNQKKFENLFNVNIKEFLINKINNSKYKKFFKQDYKILFMHDLESFALGLVNLDEFKSYKKVFCLCIGTGTGTAFTYNQQVIKQSTNDCIVPDGGFIYNYKFKDGIIDDYISARGLENLSLKYYDSPKNGKQLYELALNNDINAINTYKDFGVNIVKACKSFLSDFKPDLIVLGGQISKSYIFFGDDLIKYANNNNIVIKTTKDTSINSIKGLYNKYLD